MTYSGEVNEPDASRFLSMGQDLAAYRAFAKSASAFGLRQTEMPHPDQIDAIQAFVATAGGKKVIEAENDDLDWKVTGVLRPEGLTHTGELDGSAVVVGKVSKIVPTGSWETLTNFPGLNLLSREQRRKLRRDGPKADGSDAWSFIAGPALVLDILTIYR